ncbi:MAG TPA: proton-conducting transporter membrane subunit [Planctomycetaceae bacterium]
MELLLAIALIAFSGFPGLVLGRSTNRGQWVAALLSVTGSAIGLACVVQYWVAGDSQSVQVPWSLPGAAFDVAIDGLSAIFLTPVLLISLLGNVYGLGYWKQTEHVQNGRKLRLFYGLMTAGMALVVVARNGVLFLFAWEIMAVAAFFLVTTEDDRKDVRDAGWVYLVATHTATACLIALFSLLAAAHPQHSFALDRLQAGSLTPGTTTAVFLLALVGFGLKAGIMPLHVWLPSSHAIAPSHVSAIMSGVIIKMGIYGLVRITSLVPDPPLAWGATLLGLGVVSGVLGVAFAIGQHDLKRLLAYHSIENIGIIVMGLGLALIGRSLGHDDWVIFGLSGCLLHVWNHALFKSLLFFSAGSVIHACETREIDHLGGLAKAMPWTSLGFVVGAVAICGLPPLNGFVSEFFIYLGLFGTMVEGTGTEFAAAAFAAPALALIGALALACFVKVYGAVFLGTARSHHAQNAHESPRSMLGAMTVLGGCCVVIGIAPRVAAPVLEMGIFEWHPALQESPHFLGARASLDWISVMSLSLVVGLALASAVLWWLIRRSPLASGSTWGCGYTAPNTRMQYTASSFAQMLVDLFGWALRPWIRRPGKLSLFPQNGNLERESPVPTPWPGWSAVTFPDKSGFHSEVPDTVLDGGVLPTFHFIARLCSRLRILQQGNIQIYLLYIFLALFALLLWR